jgi:hypothetical protein
MSDGSKVLVLVLTVGVVLLAMLYAGSRAVVGKFEDLQERVDSVLAEAPAWEDSARVWADDRRRQVQVNEALRQERDAYRQEAAKWAALADARDSVVVDTLPLQQQVTFWHDRYIARTNEQMATTAALTTEMARADTLLRRTELAEARLVAVGDRLRLVTATLDTLQRARVDCPSRTAAAVAGVLAGATVALLVQ